LNSTHILSFFGVAMLFSILTGRGASYIKVPIIIGYIITGALFGPSILHYVDSIELAQLGFINVLTLALIGFNIGSELRFRDLRKMGRKIVIIVIMEAGIAFLVTGVATAIVLKSIPMGIIYGALACATAPAGTVDVIRQYQAKGELTSTLFAVMGLDDIFALILYSLAVPLAGIMLGSQNISVEAAILHSLWDITLELVLGASFGYLLVRIGRYLHDQSLFLIYSLGSLFLMCSLAELFAISPILLCMSAAIVMTNTNGIITRKFTNALTQWSPPVYLLFFVMIGTKLDFSMIRSYAWLIIVYIAFRTLGKYYGALWGGKLAKASEKVTKNLGFTLLSQAGVAIGLTLGAAKVLGDLGLDYQANQIISVMTATTFLIMLVGPVLVKYGLKRANEMKVKD